MSPLPCLCSPVRSAAEVNAAIQALAARARWTPAELAELARLRAEWLAAVAREAELAA